MDVPFSTSQWGPSKPFEEWELQPDDFTLANRIKTLNSQTTDIAAHPYEPQHWMDRAETLAKLRYPELAVGDAYKVVILCENVLETLTERPRTNLGYRNGFYMIGDRAGLDTYDRTWQRVTFTRLGEKAQKLIHDNLDFSLDHKKGRVILRQYPWLPEWHVMRSDRVIRDVNDDLTRATRDLAGGSCCVVRRFAFGRGVGARDGEDLLGVFATRDILKGARIMEEKSRTWGCNGSDGTGWANPYLPAEDLPASLRWIRKKVGKFAANTILRSRLLICAVEDGAQHPLDYPLIARLTPRYRPDEYKVIDVEKDIAVFNQVLQQHGIDIFANLNWDTYTFFTIKARIDDNSWTSPNSETISSLFSFFNHSCEPNFHWQTEKDHRTMVLSAKRDIASGEQLFVCYDDFTVEKSLAKRRSVFWKWIDGPCQCSRCLREEGEAQRGSTHSSSTGSWDTEVKPVLPEDGLILGNDLIEPID